jgi:26S proteasome regulatory subunit N3
MSLVENLLTQDREYGVWMTLFLLLTTAFSSSLFLAAQRTASLRHDDETQASLINRLLRNYLHYSLYDQADKLISKTNFPTSAPNSQYARYHYYLGRIKAVQLDYTAAHTNLQQAIRRAPAPKLAPGFYQAVHKLFVVVELLMGDIPERSLFRHPVLDKALRGYFDIVKGEFLASYCRSFSVTPCSCPYWLSFAIPNYTFDTCRQLRIR